MIGEKSFLIALAVMVILAGCSETQEKKMPKEFTFPAIEAQWIRDGKPLEFEGEQWYPTDMIEILRDEEVYYMGQYNGIDFMVEKSDVRPYDRLYTKFNMHKFRVFKKKRIVVDD